MRAEHSLEPLVQLLAVQFATGIALPQHADCSLALIPGHWVIYRLSYGGLESN
jgi:hypothetical protein